MLPLPLLTHDDAYAVALHHSRLRELPEYAKPIVRMLGGWPRPVAIFGGVLSKNRSSTISVLVDQLRRALDRHYPSWGKLGSESATIDAFMGALARLKALYTTAFDEQMSSGLVFRDRDSGVLSMPALLAEAIVGNLHSAIPQYFALRELLKPENLSKWDGHVFEKYIAQVLASRLGACLVCGCEWVI